MAQHVNQLTRAHRIVSVVQTSNGLSLETSRYHPDMPIVFTGRVAQITARAPRDALPCPAQKRQHAFVPPEEAATTADPGPPEVNMKLVDGGERSNPTAQGVAAIAAVDKEPEAAPVMAMPLKGLHLMSSLKPQLPSGGGTAEVVLRATAVSSAMLEPEKLGPQDADLGAHATGNLSTHPRTNVRPPEENDEDLRAKTIGAVECGVSSRGESMGLADRAVALSPVENASIQSAFYQTTQLLANDALRGNGGTGGGGDLPTVGDHGEFSWEFPGGEVRPLCMHAWRV